jgi:hypothetical protein
MAESQIKPKAKSIFEEYDVYPPPKGEVTLCEVHTEYCKFRFLEFLLHFDY